MRDSYLDVTSKDAISVVKSDAKKTNSAREEDANFIYRLRLNMYVAFGERNWVQESCFDRAADRQAKEEMREENERKGKLVSS